MYTQRTRPGDQLGPGARRGTSIPVTPFVTHRTGCSQTDNSFERFIEPFFFRQTLLGSVVSSCRMNGFRQHIEHKPIMVKTTMEKRLTLGCSSDRQNTFFVEDGYPATLDTIPGQSVKAKDWRQVLLLWRREAMGVFKKRQRVSLLSDLRAMKSIGVLLGVALGIVLICAFGCERKAGLRPSAPTPGQAEEKPAKAPRSELTNAHCTACHEQQPQTIAERGGKHKTAVGCMDCHTEHPPKGTGAIPECSMCHSGAAHYELAQCSSCHSDAHAPLDLKLEGAITDACLTCHQQQGDEVKKFPSAHTDLACNECHTAHRLIPNCMDCHEKHTEDMVFETCLACHPVHMPLVITYADDTPGHYCGACHEVAYGLLNKSKLKHHDVACTQCHPKEHKKIVQCVECHPAPHAKQILDKYPTCGDCHGIAHDLKG